MSRELPPCGLYRTTQAVAGVDADRLVYFHNHGNPGAGLYLPERWTHNRAHFSPSGRTLGDDVDAAKVLRPLPREGFYRVTATFFCCSKHCMQFAPEMLVQLGYNGAGRALLFVPELVGGGLTVPDRGTFVDDDALVNLVALQVPERRDGRDDISVPRGIVVH
ncbi:MAG: hypothetical protein H6709_17570 [Kofleriaceae bacterium]|nr:hypothetical protein [Myxococcales bacterium]MCB9564468.1 hypothetical protein [Kofleriaceae bacterium]MCB9573893.1 hypothetical protein [Kofleriaceae bacterium]